MRIPVATRFLLVDTTPLARVVHGTTEFVCLDYHMECGTKIFVVEFVKDSLGIGEYPGVPGE